jgi:hypothetical protein
MVSMRLWFKSWSRIPVATAGSANTLPHLATLRFDEVSMAPLSWRRLSS